MHLTRKSDARNFVCTNLSCDFAAAFGSSFPPIVGPLFCSERARRELFIRRGRLNKEDTLAINSNHFSATGPDVYSQEIRHSGLADTQQQFSNQLVEFLVE